MVQKNIKCELRDLYVKKKTLNPVLLNKQLGCKQSRSVALKTTSLETPRVVVRLQRKRCYSYSYTGCYHQLEFRKR